MRVNLTDLSNKAKAAFSTYKDVARSKLAGAWNKVSLKPYRDVLSGRLGQNIAASQNAGELANAIGAAERIGGWMRRHSEGGRMIGLGQAMKTPGMRTWDLPDSRIMQGLFGNIVESGSLSGAIRDLKGKGQFNELKRVISSEPSKTLADVLTTLWGEAPEQPSSIIAPLSENIRKRYLKWAGTPENAVKTLSPDIKNKIDKMYNPEYRATMGGFTPNDQRNNGNFVQGPHAYQDAGLLSDSLTDFDKHSFLGYNKGRGVMKLMDAGESFAVGDTTKVSRDPVYMTGQMIAPGVWRGEDVVYGSGSALHNAHQLDPVYQNGSQAVKESMRRVGTSSTAHGIVMEANLANELTRNNPHLHIVAEGSGIWGGPTGQKINAGKVLVVNDAGLDHIPEYLDANALMFDSMLKPTQPTSRVSPALAAAVNAQHRRARSMDAFINDLGLLDEPVIVNDLNKTNVGNADMVRMPQERGGGMRLTGRRREEMDRLLERLRFSGADGAEIAKNDAIDLAMNKMFSRIRNSDQPGTIMDIQQLAYRKFNRSFDSLSPQQKLQVMSGVRLPKNEADVLSRLNINMLTFDNIFDKTKDPFRDDVEYMVDGYSSQKAAEAFKNMVTEKLKAFSMQKQAAAVGGIKTRIKDAARKVLGRRGYELTSRAYKQSRTGGLFRTAWKGAGDAAFDLWEQPRQFWQNSAVVDAMMRPGEARSAARAKLFDRRARQALSVALPTAMATGGYALYRGGKAAFGGDNTPSSQPVVAGGGASEEKTKQSPVVPAKQTSGPYRSALANFNIANMNGRDMLGYGGSAMALGTLGWLLGGKSGIAPVLALLGAFGGAAAYHAYRNSPYSSTQA